MNKMNEAVIALLEEVAGSQVVSRPVAGKSYMARLDTETVNSLLVELRSGDVAEHERISDDVLLEKFAEHAHDVWAKWMRYLFTCGRQNKSGSFTMDKGSVERWKRQMNTSYADLPDGERDSDREIANEYLNLL